MDKCPKVCVDRILPRDLMRLQRTKPMRDGGRRAIAPIGKTWMNGSTLGACPTLTVLLRRTIHDHLRRSRLETILNVFQRIRFRFFRACGLASGRGSFTSRRRQCRTGS